MPALVPARRHSSAYPLGLHAVEAYRRGELEEARAGFRAFLERNPGETVARMYLERMEGMGARAPEGWNGVFAHSSK